MSVARDDYSFQRSSRRNGDALLPRLASGEINLFIALDTSGSIGDEEMREFASEVNALKGQVRANLVVHACDDALSPAGPWHFAPWDPLTLPGSLSGGGGTRFNPVFEWIEREHLRPDLMLYFTDAQGEFPGAAPPYPVIGWSRGGPEYPGASAFNSTSRLRSLPDRYGGPQRTAERLRHPTGCYPDGEGGNMSSKWIEGTVVDQQRWTDRLYSLRVDAALEPFRAGQFGRLALEIGGEMVARPYSFVNAPHETPHEFYYIHLDQGPLTSRLTALAPGDRVFLAPRAAGFLTLAEVPEAEHLWLLSTGTALGPFLSILKTGDAWQRFARVVLVHAVREAHELSYRDTIDALRAARPEQFAFVPFVSREDTDFAIRGRIPCAVQDGRLAAATGIGIDPDRSQVMLCGNPAMVADTVTVLQARGLKRHKRKEPGNIHIESYW